MKLGHVYQTGKHNFSEEIYIPLLSKSKYYTRGVGYFSSKWLSINLQGLIPLIERGGKVTYITSPFLEESDYEAMVQGSKAKQEKYLRGIFENRYRDIVTSLQRDLLVALSWMIADGVIEFRFVIPKNKHGNYHQKIGIFKDEYKNVVVVEGSDNESEQALKYNGESMSVFRSWELGQAPYVECYQDILNDIYEGKEEFYDVYKLPAFIKKGLVQFKSNHSNEQYEDDDSSMNLKIPSYVESRDYQNEAVRQWEDNDNRLLFEMGTGTGKTLTSLLASMRVYKAHKKIALIISVPQKHLLPQWEKDVREFGFHPILCYSDNKKWFIEAKKELFKFNANAIDNCCFIVTHISNSDEKKFIPLINGIHNKDCIVFIGDEVHRLGSDHLKKCLNPEIKHRIGLSATPASWKDEIGTRHLHDYFREEAFVYDIEKAINERFLTPYSYHPQFVRLEKVEQDDYVKLSKEIIKLSHIKNKTATLKNRINALSKQRADILNKSTAKIAAFSHLLRKHVNEVGGGNFKHAIVFSPEGDEHRELLGILNNLGLRFHSITYETPHAIRQQILNQFENGEIQVVVAINCLDEGVDCKKANKAYFLASTSNPRQYIQRRGRVIRTDNESGKTKADIYDFVMLPELDESEMEICKVIIKKEMARFLELCNFSLNKFNTKSVLEKELRLFSLEHLVYLTVDEFYQEIGGDNLETDLFEG